MTVAKARLSLLTALAALSLTAVAQSPTKNNIQDLRTRRLLPNATAPNFDWPRIQHAYAFIDKHRASIQNTHLTSSILALFAGRDTEPVINFTGKLMTDYKRRMQRTTELMDDILATPKEKSDFVKKNYKRGVDLALIHLQVSQAAKVQWNPKVRIPVSQQSFAYMFYAYAWQPIEFMIATNELDLAKDTKDIDDWLYLWNVLGYGMGMDAQLLPKSSGQAKDLTKLLRAYQLPGPGEEIPRRIRALIRNQMDYLYFVKDNGQPIDDPTKLEVRKSLAAQIAAVPGLSQALGLGTDALAGLNNLDRTID